MDEDKRISMRECIDLVEGKAGKPKRKKKKRESQPKGGSVEFYQKNGLVGEDYDAAIKVGHYDDFDIDLVPRGAPMKDPDGEYIAKPGYDEMQDLDIVIDGEKQGDGAGVAVRVLRGPGKKALWTASCRDEKKGKRYSLTAASKAGLIKKIAPLLFVDLHESADDEFYNWELVLSDASGMRTARDGRRVFVETEQVRLPNGADPRIEMVTEADGEGETVMVHDLGAGTQDVYNDRDDALEAVDALIGERFRGGGGETPVLEWEREARPLAGDVQELLEDGDGLDALQEEMDAVLAEDGGKSKKQQAYELAISVIRQIEEMGGHLPEAFDGEPFGMKQILSSSVTTILTAAQNLADMADPAGRSIGKHNPGNRR